MTEYDTTPGIPIPIPEPEEPPAKGDAAAAWTEVVKALDELGDSVTMWAKAVRDDPETRRRAKEIQEKLEGYSRQVGETFDAAARSDFARQVSSAAVAAGDVAMETARKVGGETAKQVASAVRAVSHRIREAAEVTRERSPGSTEETATVEVHVTAEPAPNRGEEPPAPTPSETPDDYVP